MTYGGASPTQNKGEKKIGSPDVPTMSPRFLLLLLAAAAVRPSAALIRLGATSFLDAPARFGPLVTGDGICGSLRAVDPANACAPIRSSPSAGSDSGGMAFVLIVRGNCSFEGKVRAAQEAGFNAAVVYDDEEKASLYSSHPARILLHRTFNLSFSSSSSQGLHFSLYFFLAGL